MKRRRASVWLMIGLILILSSSCRQPGPVPSAEGTEEAGTEVLLEEGYAFPKEAEGDGGQLWPSAVAWANMGLPDLSLKELSYVRIVDGALYDNEIKGVRTVSLECSPKYSRSELLLKRLENAGISMQEEEGFERANRWSGYYRFHGEVMGIQLHENVRGEITIQVLYRPYTKPDGIRMELMTLPEE